MKAMKRIPSRGPRTIGVAHSYNFIDKHPVLDIMHRAVEVSGYSFKHIHERSGVSVTTLRNWFYGDTKRPSYATVDAVRMAVGAKCVWTDADGNELRPPRGPVHAWPKPKRKQNGGP